MDQAPAGLKTTFRVLTQTDGELAARTLVAAWDSPVPAIAQAALVGLLERRDPAGQRLILQRWDTLDDRWKTLIRQQHGRMEQVLRDAILSDHLGDCIRACNAALFLEEFGLIPTLLTVLTNQVTPTADTIAATLLLLSDRLYEQSCDSSTDRRRDPKLVQQHVVRSLEPAVQRYSRHRRREIVEAFATLADRENVTFKQVLRDPHHASFLVLVDVLQKSTRPAVMQLLLSVLDDPQAPSAALSLLGNRGDLAFVRQLLRRIGLEPSSAARQNLKRINAIGWLKNLPLYMADFDDTAQQGVVCLAMGANIPRSQAFSAIEDLVHHGRAPARRAAVTALAEFRGTDANAVALAALDDSDPEVQAIAAGQLRSRGITGLLPRLMEMLESPHVVVRQAVRKNLEEFSFKRFLASFDMMDEESRQTSAALVRKVDPQTVPLLEAELRSGIRSRRLRGLAMAKLLNVVEQLEDVIIELLSDDDPLLRSEAASVLSAGDSPLGYEALEHARYDASPAVQQAAQKSLAARTQFADWKAAMADPRD